MAIQSILPPNDTPPVNLMSTDDDLTFATDPTIINATDLDAAQTLSTFEVITTSGEDGTADIQTVQTTATTSSTPVQFVTSTSPFVQLKPPTTTGRVQSPGVKNFFIRKGVDKKAPTQSFYTVRAQPIAGEVSQHQQKSLQSVSPNESTITANKKIIIKSQQIIRTGNVQSLTPLNQSGLDALNTSATDLSDILDLPILFADNEGNLQDHSGITSSQTAGATIQIETSQASATPTNILITSPDGKLPNRPVVISAANVSKLTKQSSQSAIAPTQNKLIFINRNQWKASTSSASPTTAIVKSMPPLKLVTSTSAQSGTSSLTGTGTFTKLAPGTKIDLSTLKIVKSGAASSIGGNIAHVRDTTKGTIVFKPAGSTTGLQSHQVLKSGILNPNITVRKVVNVIQRAKPNNATQIVTSVADVIVTTTSPATSVTAPALVPTPTPTPAQAPAPAQIPNFEPEPTK